MAVGGATRTLPWSWYIDPAVLELEQERIFRRFWQYAGRADEVAEPGSFSATRVGHVPVVLVRDEEDTLRAFLNVCRHRGSIVCEGSGKRSTLQCPYHAWTYGLDGRLITAPRSAREGGIETGELGLVALRAETWGPFVFVSPDPDAGPLADFLEDVPERIAAAGIDVDALRFLERSESELQANWKICAENFLECYHCPVAHPGFSAVVDVSPESYLLETERLPDDADRPAATRAARLVRPRRARSSAASSTSSSRTPSSTSCRAGRTSRSARSSPSSPSGRTASSTTSSTPTPTTRGSRRCSRSTRRSAPRTRASSSASSRASRSGLIEEGRLLPESERLVAHFQALVVDALA